MTAQSKRRTFALLALILGIIVSVTACGGNPNKPEPVCEDTNAQNYGGALPCVPKPTPAQAYAKLLGTSFPFESYLTVRDTLPDGTNVYGDEVKATIEYGFSQKILDEAKANNEEILLRACLSVDGVTEVRGGCFLRWADMTKMVDTKTFVLIVDRYYTNVKRTNFIIFTNNRASLANPSKAPTVMFTEKLTAPFNWKEQGS